MSFLFDFRSLPLPMWEGVSSTTYASPSTVAPLFSLALSPTSVPFSRLLTKLPWPVSEPQWGFVNAVSSDVSALGIPSLSLFWLCLSRLVIARGLKSVKRASLIFRSASLRPFSFPPPFISPPFGFRASSWPFHETFVPMLRRTAKEFSGRFMSQSSIPSLCQTFGCGRECYYVLCSERSFLRSFSDLLLAPRSTRAVLVLQVPKQSLGRALRKTCGSPLPTKASQCPFPFPTDRTCRFTTVLTSDFSSSGLA